MCYNLRPIRVATDFSLYLHGANRLFFDIDPSRVCQQRYHRTVCWRLRGYRVVKFSITGAGALKAGIVSLRGTEFLRGKSGFEELAVCVGGNDNIVLIV